MIISFLFFKLKKDAKCFTWIGNIPGIIGHVIPAARQSDSNLINVSGWKKSCVIIKSAPQSTFSFKYFKSSS